MLRLREEVSGRGKIYLYHQHELEELYQRRAEPEVFL